MPPNILLITLDELRFDGLKCYGNPTIRTPNIDRLARDGVRLEHFFTQNPVCQPSRATFVTGRYPKNHGVKYNWYDLPSNEVTLQSVLGDADYDTVAVGKMHFEPTEELQGFKRRFWVEGKMFDGEDEYRRYLTSVGLRDKYRAHILTWADSDHFGTLDWPLEGTPAIDEFIGDGAVEILREISGPWFVWTSFVNPHMPYDPPPPYDTMYDPSDVELPPDWQFPQDSRTPEFRVGSAGKDFASLSEETLRRIIARYYGQVTLVDDQIGRLLSVLEERGEIDETVIMLTTDHGDFLGHRGLIWKAARGLYDDLLRVPFIVRYPPEVPTDRVISQLCEGTDLMPTVLEYAGVPIPDGVQGLSMRSILRQDATPWRDAVYAESLDIKMLRDHHWKIIYYAGQPYGELFDLKRDPSELDNLWFRPGYEGIRAWMVDRLLTRVIQTEDPLPQPRRRPGYFELSGYHSQQELGEAGSSASNGDPPAATQ